MGPAFGRSQRRILECMVSCPKFPTILVHAMGGFLCLTWIIADPTATWLDLPHCRLQLACESAGKVGNHRPRKQGKVPNLSVHTPPNGLGTVETRNCEGALHNVRKKGRCKSQANLPLWYATLYRSVSSSTSSIIPLGCLFLAAEKRVFLDTMYTRWLGRLA